jgi:hypothetical protein
MRKPSRFVLAAAIVTAILSGGLGVVFAQSALATADASKFIGAWTLGMDSPQGAVAMNLTLKDQGGKVAGTITADIAPDPANITDITKDGDKLVLKYNLDFQGQAIPVQVTIIPDGANWKSSFDFAGGQFVMDGTAVKK